VNIREGNGVFIKFHEVVRGGLSDKYSPTVGSPSKGIGGLFAPKTSCIVVVAVVLRPSRILCSSVTFMVLWSLSTID
jgi:hypothetical protein